MTAYVIFDSKTSDPEAMSRYAEKAVPSLRAYGGEIVAASSDVEVREGDWEPGRVVIVRFPSLAAARSWYDSAEYRAIRLIRENAAKVRMMIVEGR